MRRARFATSVVALVLTGACLAGCSSGGAAGPGATVPTTRPTGTGRVTLVTLGSTDTLGGPRRQPLLDTWPQILYRRSFPLRATLVNLARNRARVADGLQEQVGDAVALHPTVAVVWFGVSDAFAGTDPAVYRRELAELVGGLTGVGSRVVIVIGPAPPGTGVDPMAYDEASAAVARAAHVDLVDLRAVPMTPGAQTRVADAIAKVLGTIR